MAAKKSLVERFLAKVEQTPGCWNWTGGKTTSGYGSFAMNRKPTKAHRAAYLLFVGPITPVDGADYRGTCVIHSCDNRLCVNPAHLRLGTHRDNMDDKRARDRFVSNPLFGERHQNAKLSDADIRRIRALRDSGIGPVTIGRMFGVRHSTIHRIAKGLGWTHVKEASPCQ